MKKPFCKNSDILQDEDFVDILKVSAINFYSLLCFTETSSSAFAKGSLYVYPHLIIKSK